MFKTSSLVLGIAIAGGAMLGCANAEPEASPTHTATTPGKLVGASAVAQGLGAESEQLSGTTSTYYVIYGKPNSSLQLCSTSGCASEGFYMQYNEPDNEFRLVSRNQSTFTDRLVVERDSGNVGIGTNSPSQKLDVNGTIRAKRILVENATADYVFEDGYAMLSLEEVDEYIKDKGHLPEIPNAAEVAAEGADLARTQTLLLQKIEELTLYAIEQNKQLGDQSQRIAELERHQAK